MNVAYRCLPGSLCFGKRVNKTEQKKYHQQEVADRHQNSRARQSVSKSRKGMVAEAATEGRVT